VVMALTGLQVHWKSPPREDAQTTWGEAIRRHGAHTLLGAAWAAGAYWLDASYAWWLLLPVVGALTLSIPLSVWSSRVVLGRILRRARLLLIPEETAPPMELRVMDARAVDTPLPGFVDAVVDPRVNAVACAVASSSARFSSRAQARRHRAVTAALKAGPWALTDDQKLLFLKDPVALAQLHLEVWTSPAPHPSWLAACLRSGGGARMRRAS